MGPLVNVHDDTVSVTGRAGVGSTGGTVTESLATSEGRAEAVHWHKACPAHERIQVR